MNIIYFYIEIMQFVPNIFYKKPRLTKYPKSTKIDVIRCDGFYMTVMKTVNFIFSDYSFFWLSLCWQIV